MVAPKKFTIRIDKYSDELGILWGWVSVADLVDLQDDTIPGDELIKAMYSFMERYYSGNAVIKVNHSEVAEAVIVESAPAIKAGKVAWWVGVKLLSDELLQSARDGEISGFSIGGFADSEEIKE